MKENDFTTDLSLPSSLKKSLVFTKKPGSRTSFSKKCFHVISAGYGTIAPRTTLGRVVTLAYALLGIPLTLIYLSSTGGVLARVARGVFSR